MQHKLTIHTSQNSLTDLMATFLQGVLKSSEGIIQTT